MSGRDCANRIGQRVDRQNTAHAVAGKAQRRGGISGNHGDAGDGGEMPALCFIQQLVRGNDGGCLQMSRMRNFPKHLQERARERRQLSALRNFTSRGTVSQAV